MKFQILFSWKNKKNMINLLSAELFQRVVSNNPETVIEKRGALTLVLLNKLRWHTHF